MSKDNAPQKNALSIATLEERVNVLGRAVFGSENFGKVMNSAVVTRTRIKRGFADRMGQGLHFYNMPTQDDVVALGEQCVRIEERLVRIEAAIQALVGQANNSSARPPRTKKPAKKRVPTAAAKSSSKSTSK